MYEHSELKVFKTIFFFGGGGVQYLITDQKIYYEQMYARLMNYVDSHC